MIKYLNQIEPDFLLEEIKDTEARRFTVLTDLKVMWDAI